jgi:hypothetical protein
MLSLGRASRPRFHVEAYEIGRAAVEAERPIYYPSREAFAEAMDKMREEGRADERPRLRTVIAGLTEYKRHDLPDCVVTKLDLLEPIQEELESDESVVIPCLEAIRDRSPRCGSLNTV